ncbi:MAG TPA: hypothetical protein VFO40_05315 [Chthoniobacterales bacterium]|nr:hypothetical protein [Chthoniobacterales bacterium]
MSEDHLFIETTPRLLTYLDQLITYGLFGTTREQVARNLIDRQILRLIQAGFIERKY